MLKPNADSYSYRDARTDADSYADSNANRDTHCNANTCTHRNADSGTGVVGGASVGEQALAEVSSTRTTVPPYTSLLIGCLSDNELNVSLEWPGAIEVSLDELVFLEYTYWLDKQEGGTARTSYWAWTGGLFHFHAQPGVFVQEIRSADTLDVRIEFVDDGHPFEATFNLEGIEWAISQVPCGE